MDKKRKVTDRMNLGTYQINYQWDQKAFDRFMIELANLPGPKKNTSEVIDNELMAMDLLETVVDDSANSDAITMLDSIGIKC
jgi:hypothetical protein